MVMKEVQPRSKTAAYHGFRDVVSALANPLGHARHGFVGMVETQKDQLHPITGLLPAPDVAQLGAARQGGFKGEALARTEMALQLRQHQAPGLQGGGFGGKGRQAGSDEVGIDEHRLYVVPCGT
jgi:hypothetical protein